MDDIDLSMGHITGEVSDMGGAVSVSVDTGAGPVFNLGDQMARERRSQMLWLIGAVVVFALLQKRK